MNRPLRLFLAFLFGAASFLAFPPYNLVPILWLSFPGLFLLLRGAAISSRLTFWVGWSFAFGFFIPSLYWIAGALFVDIGAFWWALPFAVLGLPALLAVYYGLSFLMLRRWDMTKPYAVIIFALCWFVADLARSYLFTGFPWNIMGYVWGESLAILQLTYLIGIEGLTLLTLLLASLPAFFFVLPDRRKAGFVVFCGVVGLAIVYAAGSFRLADAPFDAVPDVRVRIVQPGTEQIIKWDPEKKADNFEKLVRLTFAPEGLEKVTHFIWPESAPAYYLTEEDSLRAYLADLMQDHSVLITGVIRRSFYEAVEPRYYNSLIVMNGQGHVVAGYDKHHLVPFGEYVPFQEFLPFPLISTMGATFTAGDGIRTIRAPRFPPFSSLVCYEAIFSGEVVEKNDPPRLLVNVTNDAWYRGTIGPDQHYLIARVRAIEEGLPMIRVANMGISAVIDAYGRPWALVGKEQPGFADSDLPEAIQ